MLCSVAGTTTLDREWPLWCSLEIHVHKKIYMMYGYSHCNTDELQHFEVPVFREIEYIAPSEQNRMIKTPPPHTKFLMNISRSIYI